MALTPVLRRLRGRRVVLASASPRRRDILSYTVTSRACPRLTDRTVRA